MIQLQIDDAQAGVDIISVLGDRIFDLEQEHAGCEGALHLKKLYNKLAAQVNEHLQPDDRYTLYYI